MYLIFSFNLAAKPKFILENSKLYRPKILKDVKLEIKLHFIKEAIMRRVYGMCLFNLKMLLVEKVGFIWTFIIPMLILSRQ